MIKQLNQDAIKELIPHRDPFLLLDEILDYEEGKTLVAQRQVTGEESFFKGHFPQFPVVPGVLLIETMAQAGAVLEALTDRENNDIMFLVGVDEAKFKSMVRPGDTLRIEVELLRRRRSFIKFSGQIVVNDQQVCYAVVNGMKQAV